MAYLCTETTDYRYMEKLDAQKKWFKTHIDFIMQTYGGSISSKRKIFF
jgi:abelson tyrosine-protein kinase 1